MTPAERAITALREAADALDALDLCVRNAAGMTLITSITPTALRTKADAIDARIRAFVSATTDPEAAANRLDLPERLP